MNRIRPSRPRHAEVRDFHGRLALYGASPSAEYVRGARPGRSPQVGKPEAQYCGERQRGRPGRRE